ncbi:hypothetical protein I352_02656 [Cryptococcus deuterogattii MMRL2647]|nr:hypothetical protein I352_02656 [Cryptococcus deuterogattii MMRL2647]
MSHLPSEVPMLRLSYNDIHKAIQDTAVEIKKKFAPTLFIAIGGGGFIPARILRTQLKNDVNGKKRNIPIQAVGLVLYEDMGGVSNIFFSSLTQSEFERRIGIKALWGRGPVKGGKDGTDETRSATSPLSV